MPIILDIQKTEIRRIVDQGQLEQKGNPISKPSNTHTKKKGWWSSSADRVPA
jgi:hypothetical protein